MKNIVIFVPENVVEMSISLMKDLCWVASSYALVAEKVSGDEKNWVQLVSLTSKEVMSFSGGKITTDILLDDVPMTGAKKPDAIFLGAFWGSIDDVMMQNRALCDWLVYAHSQQIPIAALSNAPFFIAEAGLLDDRAATVYPPVSDAFRHRFPKVNLRSSSAITDAGELYCANGIASGCDLIVAILERLYGPEIARRISQEFLLGFNRSYTVANVSFDGQKYHHDAQILLAQQFLERHFSEPTRIEAIAEDIGMSPRNFSRRFKLATGDSPSVYLQRVRIETAKELLRTTSLQISEVSYRAGFSDVSYFARSFSRYEGCKPKAYREQYASS